MTAAASTPQPRQATLDLWGKSSEFSGLDGHYPLLGHLLDTAAVARAVCDILIPQRMRDHLAASAGSSWDQWRAETTLLAGMHDAGKADCHFQNLSPADCDPVLQGIKSRDPRSGGDGRRYKRHAYNSALLVSDAAKVWDASDTARCRAAQIVGGHHGVVPPYNSILDRRRGASLIDCAQDPNNPDADTAMALLRAAREDIFATVRDTTAGTLTDADCRVPSAAVSLAVVVLADWLASQRWFLHAQRQQLGPRVTDPGRWMASAEELARDEALPKAGLLRPLPARVTADSIVPGGVASGLQRSIESRPSRSCVWGYFHQSPNRRRENRGGRARSLQIRPSR